MDYGQLKVLSVDELWLLHEEVTSELSRKIEAEKAKLEERLQKIKMATTGRGGREGHRRPYPKVLPKYRNPKNPKETWSGRGKQPRWLTAQLGAGKKLNQFLISRP